MIIDPEDQIAAEIAAAEARGEDPYADKASAEPEEKQAESTTEPQAKEPEPEAANPADPVEQVQSEDPEKAGDDDSKPEANEQAAEKVVSQQPTTFQTSMPADYKAQRTVLVGEKAALMQKLLDGELSSEAFAAEEARISDALEDLTAQRIRAETLQEANIQTQAAFQKQEIKNLVESKKSEVDYASDTKAQKQFDIALKSIASDADSANLSYTQIITEAHKVVMALRGISKPKAEVTQRPKREAPQPPQTLSGLPTAASNSAKSVERILAELSGDDLERAFDALPKSELDRINKLS